MDEQTGRAFVANPENDSVSMLDGRTGAILATSLVARSPSAVAMDAHLRQVFVASSGVGVCTNLYPQKCSIVGSGVSILDARTGVLLRIIALQTSPIAIAVDEATQRVFVVNSALVLSQKG